MRARKGRAVWTSGSSRFRHDCYGKINSVSITMKLNTSSIYSSHSHSHPNPLKGASEEQKLLYKKFEKSLNYSLESFSKQVNVALQRIEGRLKQCEKSIQHMLNQAKDSFDSDLSMAEVSTLYFIFNYSFSHHTTILKTFSHTQSMLNQYITGSSEQGAPFKSHHVPVDKQISHRQ
ncbi:hypothetical protein EON65_42705 [archaeon]|nr:MAG: hypothetical protein EON65_42705 [archaeon]